MKQGVANGARQRKARRGAVRHQLHHVGLLVMVDGLIRRPTAMEKREDTSRRVKSNNGGRNRDLLDGLGRRPTAMGMRYDTAHSGTFRSEEEAQASPRRAAQDEGRSYS